MTEGTLFNSGFLGENFNWWIGQIADDSYWRDNIISTTDITDDVVGWLDDNDVTRTLNAISKLDKDGVLPKDVLL